MPRRTGRSKEESVELVVKALRQGLDEQQIAEMLGLTPKSVKVYLSRARCQGVGGLTYQHWTVGTIREEGWKILMRRIMEEAL
jgi:predicted transcriptional regulator